MSAEGFKPVTTLISLQSDDLRDLDFELSLGERIHGRVIDARSSQPIAEASVTLYGRQSRQTVTDEGGNFTFSGLDPGEYAVLVEALQKKPEDRRVEITEGEPVHIQVPLWSGTRWLGEVRSENGLATEVTLLHGAAKYVAPVTDEGTFVIEDGPDGRVGYYLRDKDGGVMCTGHVIIDPGLAFANVQLRC